MTQSSPTWSATSPQLSVVVSTYNRRASLAGLVDAVGAQEVDVPFELVVVDNGSDDDTWDELARLARSAAFPMVAARVEQNRGPSSGRNAGAECARGPVLVFTDDDCRPAAGWLQAMADAAEGRWAVLQGRTQPVPGVARGPWDHTVNVSQLTGLFETCNVAYRREDVLAVGGFQPLPRAFVGRGGQPFGGEDTWLGWAVARRRPDDPVVFVSDAIVHHAVEPRTYGEWLEIRAGTSLFPSLVRHVPDVRDHLFARCFLTPRTATLELALLGLVVAAVGRRPAATMLALPYLRAQFGPAARARDAEGLRLAAQRAVGDLVAVRALWVGSLRHRSVVL
jgi:hypothetical protein